MKLIGSLNSPFARKVRIVLAEKKLDYIFELEDVWAADTVIQATNPLGKVPCLIMDDGSALFDSHVIVEYLDTLTPVCKLLPANGNSRDRADIKCWESLADGIVDAAILVFLERKLRTPEQQNADWIARQLSKVNLGLATLSQRLADSPYCAGNYYTLADVAVGCALAWLSFRFPEIGWRDAYPNLGKLADKLADRLSFKDTMPQL